MIHDDLSVLKNFMWAIINAPIVDLYLPQRSTGDMFISGTNIIDNISFYICSVSLIMVNICQLSCFLCSWALISDISKLLLNMLHLQNILWKQKK